MSSLNFTSSDCYSVPDFSQASSVHPPLPTSSFHAPPSSSHGLEIGSDKVQDQNQEQRAILIAAPVVLQHGGGHQHPRWEPFDHQNKTELCKAEKEFGRESKYFKGLLRTAFSSNVLVLHDLPDLFSCLLVPTEYLPWERAWKRLLCDLLPQLWQNPQCAVDMHNQAITFNHFCGEGEWAEASKQAEGIPMLVLEEIEQAAEKAFITLPCADPTLSFVSIKRAPSKSFVGFMECLCTAVESQVENRIAQSDVITAVTQTNANEDCWKIIQSLPLDPLPTLDLMVEACMKCANV